MTKKIDRCAVCNGTKPPSGWKQHARFPGMFICSRVCLDTAGSGGSASESVSAVSKPDPVLASAAANRSLHAQPPAQPPRVGPEGRRSPAPPHREPEPASVITSPIAIPPAGQPVAALDAPPAPPAHPEPAK